MRDPSISIAFTGVVKVPSSEISLDGTLGSGSFSTVFKGLWRKGPVAIKVFRNDESISRVIEAELATLSSAHHPRLVSLLAICDNVSGSSGCDIASGKGLVMELLEGGSLFHNLHVDTNSCRFSLAEKLQIACEIADGMRYLHSIGIVHRDLKSGNVLLGNGAHCKICDFGLSNFKDILTTHTQMP